MKKRGNLLTENVIFIVLTIFFLMILMLFLSSKSKNVSVLEEKYAKQISLMIDSAEPGMGIHLNIEEAVRKAKKELGENSINDIISLERNIVTVKLSKDSGYSYSFFNDVNVNSYLNKDKTEYILFIS